MKLNKLTIFLLVLLSVTAVKAQYGGPTATDDQYEPDNTYGTATAITIDETQIHSLTYQDVDYYTFSINETKIIEISASAQYSSLEITLYDANLTLISNTQYYGYYNRIVKQLNAGTYYFVIQSYYSETINQYDTVLHDLTSANEPNGSANSATFLPMNQTILDSITYTNSVSDLDYFYINVTKTAYYDLKLTTLIDSLDINLRDSSNLLINSFDQRYQYRSNQYQLQITLNPGKYYIKIQGFDRPGLYNISFFMLFDDQYEPNDSIVRASTLPFNTTINATLMNYPYTNTDVWKFSPQNTGRYSVRIYGLSDLDVSIQDSTYNNIGWVNTYYTNNGFQYYYTNLILGPGDYYITINSYSSYSGNYSLYFSNMIPDNNEPNNDAAHATQLYGIDQIYQLAPNFHNDSDVDWYKFPMTDSVTLDLQIYANSFSNTPGRVELTLYDANLNQLSTSSDRVALFLQAGDYYIEISQATPTIDYFLNYNFVYPDGYENDNTSPNAKRISNSESQSHTIHTPDDVDWFYFDVSEESAVTIALSGYDGDPEMYLYSSDLTQLAYNDDYHGNTFPTIKQVLKQGTYYVKVQALNQEDIVSYYEINLQIENPNGGSSDYSVSSRLQIGYSFINILSLMGASFVTLLILKKHYRLK